MKMKREKNSIMLFVITIILITGNAHATECDDEIARVCKNAEAEQKKVLLIFGADWCPDCTALDSLFTEDPIKKIIEDTYIVLKIDIGRFDKNIETAASYGVIPKNGIPAAVVIDSKNTVEIEASFFKWSHARSFKMEQVLCDLTGAKQ